MPHLLVRVIRRLFPLSEKIVESEDLWPRNTHSHPNRLDSIRIGSWKPEYAASDLASMSDHSSIEWTETTWNPTTGCDRISPGCDNCYVLTLAMRLKAMGSAK